VKRFAVVVALLAAVPAAGAQARDRCARPGSKTLAADATTRAYSLRGALYGCERRTGRARVLADRPERDADHVERWRRPVRVKGRFVAWLTRIDYVCKTGSGCPPDDPGFSTSIDIADVRTGSRSGAGYTGTLGRVLVGETGSLVYVMTRAAAPELWVTDGGGTRQLDGGDVRGLQLRGTTLTWANTGQRRAAYVAGGTTCEPHVGHVRAWNEIARVYDRGAPSAVLYGCLWRRSRPIRLTAAPHANVEVAGRFAAWSEPGSVVVRDLIGGRELRPPAGAAVQDVAVGGDGVVAWLEEDGRLLATRGTVPVELARGEIEPGSLAVRGGLVHWRQDGAARSAPAPPDD
jgi:hypothetical protein